MELHAFVLHLARATGRRANAQALKQACTATRSFAQVDVWPAVDGSAIASDDLASIIGTHLFEPTYPFSLRTGEIGCFLSHRNIWAEIQARDIDAALIIEDDAGVGLEAFAQSIALASRYVDELGYIQLQTRPTAHPATLIEAEGSCQLKIPQIGGLRTTAQIVSKDAAAHLSRLSDRIDRPVDTFVQSHWQTGLRPAAIYPSGVADIADQLDGTTIQGGRKGIFEKLGREFNRSRYRRAVKSLSEHSHAPQSGGIAHD